MRSVFRKSKPDVHRLEVSLCLLRSAWGTWAATSSPHHLLRVSAPRDETHRLSCYLNLKESLGIILQRDNPSPSGVSRETQRPEREFRGLPRLCVALCEPDVSPAVTRVPSRAPSRCPLHTEVARVTSDDVVRG